MSSSTDPLGTAAQRADALAVLRQTRYGVYAVAAGLVLLPLLAYGYWQFWHHPGAFIGPLLRVEIPS